MTTAQTRYEEHMEHLLKMLDRTDARIWSYETDKFVHCLEYLGLSLVTDGDAYCTTWVDRMETRLEAMIGDRS